MLWFVVLSNYLARLMPTTMHASLVAAIPMTEAQFGLLTSVLLWTYGLMSPLAGFLADRFSRSTVILISMAVWSAVTWLTSYARTLDQLLVLRALMGLSEACYLPAALALISDYHTGGTRSLATGIHNSGYVLGMGLSGVAGWLAERYSWHYAFSLIGLVGLGYCAGLAFVLRDPPRTIPAGSTPIPRVRLGEALTSLFSRGSFLLTLAAWACVGLAIWAVYGWTPVYLKERFNLSQAAAGFSGAGLMSIAAIFGLLLGGALADRWSRTNPRGRMLVPGVGLLIAAPCILLFVGAGGLVVALIGVALYRIFHAFGDANMMPILCEIADPRYRATGYGLINMTGCLAGGIGIFLPGLLRDGHVDLRIIFVLVAAISALAGSFYFFMRPSQSPPRKALSGGD